MQIAMVGLGGQGRLLAAAWLRIETARIAAVYDADASRVDAFLGEHSEQAIYAAESLEDLVSLADIDCICICTPPAFHAEQVELALRGGKHVFVEKPLATDLRGARRIEQAARQHPHLCCMVGSAYLTFLPAVETAREWLTSQPLGPIDHGRITYRLTHQPRGWFLDPALSGGGVWIDLAYHPLSVLASLELGGLERCTVREARMGARQRGQRVEDWAVVWADVLPDSVHPDAALPGSWPLLMDVAWGAGQAEGELFLAGPEGELRLDLLQNRARLETASESRIWNPEEPVLPDLARREMAYFADCVAQQRTPQLGNVNIAFQVHEMILAAYNLVAR